MFVLLVLTLLCGLALGLARGGSLHALRRIHVSRPWLFVAVPGVLAVGRLVGPLHPVAWGLATVGAAAFAGSNRRLSGLAVLSLGIALNALVITVNQGDMPVSEWGAEQAGVAVEDIRASDFHEPASAQSRLRPLGDVIPLPFPGVPAVVSIGDVLMASGLGMFGALVPVRAGRTLQARRPGGVRAWTDPRPASAATSGDDDSDSIR